MGETLDFDITSCEDTFSFLSLIRIYTAAPYALSEPSPKPCTSNAECCIIPIPKHRGIVSSFSCNNSDFQLNHFALMSLSNGSSQCNPLKHNSWKRILAPTVKGDMSASGSNIFDARLGRTLFFIGSWDEMIPLVVRNLKWSELKAYDTPSAFRGSLESNSTNGDEALLAGSKSSVTTSELLAHLVKLNAAVIIISDICCWSFKVEFTVSAPVRHSSRYIFL